MSILATRTCTPPNGGDIIDSLKDDGLEIDRWENDGGRSPGKLHG